MNLAVRMALYRRLNDAKDTAEIESRAAEMIDRFGPLPDATANLVKLIEIKHQAIEACIAKVDVGARGTLVSFHEDRFPDPAGLIAYVERLKGTAKLRPDMKLVNENSGQKKVHVFAGRPGEPPEWAAAIDQGPERDREESRQGCAEGGLRAPIQGNITACS